MAIPFSSTPAYYREYRAKHRDKYLARQRAWYKNHPEYRKRRNLLHSYGLTLADYTDMLEKQGGVCAICLRPETRISPQTQKILPLSVDHDHTTDRVRGLLCTNCNLAIGLIGDSQAHALAMAAYLERTQAQENE